MNHCALICISVYLLVSFGYGNCNSDDVEIDLRR